MVLYDEKCLADFLLGKQHGALDVNQWCNWYIGGAGGSEDGLDWSWGPWAAEDDRAAGGVVDGGARCEVRGAR